MRRPKFRLRSLMLLVLLVALGTSAYLHLSRLGPDDLIEQLAILGPFLAMVLLKMGLVLESRLRRARREEAIDRPLEDRPPSGPSSRITTRR